MRLSHFHPGGCQNGSHLSPISSPGNGCLLHGKGYVEKSRKEALFIAKEEMDY